MAHKHKIPYRLGYDRYTIFDNIGTLITSTGSKSLSERWRFTQNRLLPWDTRLHSGA